MPEHRTEIFEPMEVITAQTELLRCLVLLLMGKKMVSEKEIMLLATFAKKRLESHSHDPRYGKRASAYVDLFLRTLQPDAPTPPKDRQ